MKVTDSPEGIARLVGEVPGEPSEVFRWFTEPELLTQWWPEAARTEPRIDGSFELAWPSQGTRLLGHYLVVEPGSRLVFTWAFAHEPAPPRTVDVRLVPSDGETMVTIDHVHGDDPDERQAYIDGWKFFMERLRTALSATQ